MSFSVNTNVSSMQAQNYLQMSSNFQSKTIGKVTSGLRIVNSGDDAAGLAVANGDRSNEAVLRQGILNANDGLSQLQIVDGGMSNISQLLDRARTLATQSASGTFTGDRTALNSEFSSVISEIDRQAQAIGMNQNGTFAKSLSVFVGGGQGTTSTAAISNGTIGVNLGSATVDAKSLGLNAYKAQNTHSYDLSATSATSVSQIIADEGKDTSGNAITTANFTFNGAGFAASSGGTAPVSVSISTSGITDAAGLATAINNAIYSAANPTGTPSTSVAAFKAAGITASVVTDSSGHEQLAFNSSSAAFQVSGDKLANAFMGYVADSRTSKVAGEGSTYVQATSALPAISTDLSAATLTFKDASGTAIASLGTSGNGVVAFDSTMDGSSTSITAQAAVDNINTLLDASAVANGSASSTSNIRAELKDGKLAFTALDGTEFSAQVTGANALGLGTTANASQYQALTSGGVYQSAQEVSTGSNTDYENSAYNFAALASGKTQAITINTQRADGSIDSFSMQLDHSTGADVNTAMKAINNSLQATGDSTLQAITAERDQNGIRFVSTQAFSVALGTATAANQGLYEIVNGSNKQGAIQLNSTVQGGGGTADISTQSGAQNAVSLLAKAVQSLGQAQAVVGRSENQLNYAVNLAQSQLTNTSAAESAIRDADLATESANLTKAQILMQAGVAALAQANSAPQALLKLLG